MRIKYYGLAFDYEPSEEVNFDDVDLVKGVNQKIHNFVYINYYKFAKSFRAINQNGFMQIDMKLFIEMYMIDENPRKYIYDDKEGKIFRILETPLEQVFNPAKRKMYQLPIELITNNEMKFDIDFIKAKFNELREVANANL